MQPMTRIHERTQERDVQGTPPASLMQRMTTRRGLLGALLAGSAAGGVGSVGGSVQARGQAGMPEAWLAAETASPARQALEARERLKRTRLPNATLVDDRGRTVKFYDDVMKNRAVIVNVMYTVCSNVCTPATRNLAEARRLLGEQAKDVSFVSLSLTPLVDGPAELAAFKKMHGIGDDWMFLTGRVDQMELVQRAMGFLSDNPEDELGSHAGTAVICDERNVRWSHANTLATPKSIARMIRFELV